MKIPITDTKYLMWIFCHKCEAILPESVVSYIKDGSLLKGTPEIIIDKAGNSNWTIAITYEVGKAPILISTSDPDIVGEERIRQMKFVLELSKVNATKKRIETFLNNVCRIYTITINRLELSDDCWEMLDIVQGMLISECKGLLLTGDNEFFGEGLKKIYKI